MYFIHPHTHVMEVEGGQSGKMKRASDREEQGRELEVNVVKVVICLNEKSCYETLCLSQ